MFKKSIAFSLLLAVFFLAGCQTTQDPSKVRADLNIMADKYEKVWAELVRSNEAGGIDPATWKFLRESNDFFVDQWSLVVVDLSDTREGYDWKLTLSVVTQILTTIAPVVDAIIGGPYLSTIMSAANTGQKLVGREHMKRVKSERLDNLKRMAARLKK